MRPLTVRLHVAALRFFFVKTLGRHRLDDTPYPKAPRRLPQILSVEEVARVIDAAASLSHRTMLMVLPRPACETRSCAICRSPTSTAGGC